MWLLIGSVAVAGAGGKGFNRSLLIDPQGKITARYDKIHLFDVTLPQGESHRESARYEAGNRAVVVTVAASQATQVGMAGNFPLTVPATIRIKMGGTEIVFEGVPTYPDAGRFWKMIQDHKVSIFYTAPTAIRSLIKAGGNLPKNFNLQSLRILGTVGEPSAAPVRSSPPTAAIAAAPSFS